MAALRRVEWTERAEGDLERIYGWTDREADCLLELVQEIELLS